MKFRLMNALDNIHPSEYVKVIQNINEVLFEGFTPEVRKADFDLLCKEVDKMYSTYHETEHTCIVIIINDKKEED